MSVHSIVHILSLVAGFSFAGVMNYKLELGQDVKEVLWCGLCWSALCWVHYLMGIFMSGGSAFRHLFGF